MEKVMVFLSNARLSNFVGRAGIICILGLYSRDQLIISFSEDEFNYASDERPLHFFPAEPAIHYTIPNPIYESSS